MADTVQRHRVLEEEVEIAENFMKAEAKRAAINKSKKTPNENLKKKLIDWSTDHLILLQTDIATILSSRHMNESTADTTNTPPSSTINKQHEEHTDIIQSLPDTTTSTWFPFSFFNVSTK